MGTKQMWRLRSLNLAILYRGNTADIFLARISIEDSCGEHGPKSQTAASTCPGVDGLRRPGGVHELVHERERPSVDTLSGQQLDQLARFALPVLGVRER